MQTKKSTLIAGTAVFSALVAIVEYLSVPFPVLRIPFPYLPYLKFDLAEIPAALSFFVFGLPVGIATSFIVPLTIIARGTSNPLGAWIKGLAIFSTIIGFAPLAKKNKYLAGALGIGSRVIIMALVNAVILPMLFPNNPRYNVELFIQLLIGVFNSVHAVLTIGGSYIIYKAILSRIPGLYIKK